ncbi:MAG: glycosyltransferase [Candidatus Binataceae bacterium]
MARLVARGKYIYEDGRKFLARGVSYGPFPPNSRGERFPEPKRAAADFAQMRELGANLVRVYVAPPEWLFEAAHKAGLRLMVGIPWPFHMAFLDSRDMKRDIRAAIRDGVTQMRKFGDAIFAFSLGNEIRSDIVRWHGPRAVSRFLAELYEIGKSIAPEALFTYSNYPSAEYLDLGFLDFVSFNVYLHHEPDYRRYLTHLLAASGEQPVVLSETGMDTIRNGEEQQAQLLTWQARAAFELGLSGFVVFAFTDQWHTGGAEITDWAFGLVTSDRRPKRAFAALAQVFGAELPPPLGAAPRVTVAVAAYNAARTIVPCLESLRALNYPQYETIVVDDGSSDETAALAERAGARVIRRDHQGLGAARNAAREAASGEIVAYIDADARADRDWLYHLVETMTRRDAAAAGGPNFAPPALGSLTAALAAAPGLPREVRTGDADLAQICGCNMAVRAHALTQVDGFDPLFTAAGDDVDLSWRLADRGATLAAAPGAVVIHERRATVRAYIAQQAGYGGGEGLLYRKYPYRMNRNDGIYGASGWLDAVLGGARVYYGVFGRGLFQSLYPGSQLPPIAELPLCAAWVAASALLFVAGSANEIFGALGRLGFAITIACAIFSALRAPAPRGASSLPTRAWLALLFLCGPLVRSFQRERKKWLLEFSASDIARGAHAGFEPSGSVVLHRDSAGTPIEPAKVLEAMRKSLVRRGLAVAVTDGFQEYDLEIVLPPGLRIPINAIRRGDARLALRWRVRLALRRALAAGVVGLVVLAVAGLSAGDALSAVLLGGVSLGALALARAWRLPGAILAAAGEAGNELGLRAEETGDQW